MRWSFVLSKGLLLAVSILILGHYIKRIGPVRYAPLCERQLTDGIFCQHRPRCGRCYRRCETLTSDVRSLAVFSYASVAAPSCCLHF